MVARFFGGKQKVGPPHLKLDPAGEFQHFYGHTAVAFGDAAGRKAYFQQLEEANPQARFEHLGLRDAVRARELRVEMEVLMRIEGSGGAGYYLSGNSAFEQRIIVVNELPEMGKKVYDDEVAVASELANLGRICRAVGFTIFYGLHSLAEFKAKGWGNEPAFNASCSTQVRVDADGAVVGVERYDEGGLADVYEQIAYASR
jgi:hypothetical protein